MFFVFLGFFVSVLAILLAIVAIVNTGELKKLHNDNFGMQNNNNAKFAERIFVLENRANFKVVK